MKFFTFFICLTMNLTIILNNRVENTNHNLITNANSNSNSITNHNTNKNKLHSKFKNKIKNKFKNKLNSKNKQIYEPEKGLILLQKWVKYFKYYNEAIEHNKTPSTFQINSDYSTQTEGIDLNRKDKDGQNLYIADKNSFFVNLFEKQLIFGTHKQMQLQKNYDAIDISNIDTVYEDMQFTDQLGGIQDFGNFAEGFCFKLIINNSNSNKLNYVICAANEIEKRNFMSLIKTLKVQLQKAKGLVATIKAYKQLQAINDQQHKDKSKQTLINLMNPSKCNKIPVDGYWVTLQEWTPCSLKCGGGISTFQRQCIQPKFGGSPCIGQAILTKVCNTEPCLENQTIETKNCGKILKPVIKVVPFLNRPQRYQRCIVKEADLMLIDPKFNQFDIKIPVRIVMNNMTFSIFGNEEYDSLKIAFNLKQTDIVQSKKYKNCFKVFNNQEQSGRLCEFTQDLTKDNKIFIEEWIEQFNLFKTKCNTILIDKDSFNAKLKAKIAIAHQELLEEAQQTARQKLTNELRQAMRQSLEAQSRKAETALRKELQIENKIKEEEREREQQEQEDLLASIKMEQEKNNCLLKRIKEKEIENDNHHINKETNEQMQDIKEKMDSEIKRRRDQLKQQILQMRQKNDKFKNSLKQKLFEVKQKIQSDMQRAYRMGSINKCKTALKTRENRNNYCQASFIDLKQTDLVQRFDDCKNGDDFCIFCCNNEFGKINQDKRDSCYQEICSSNNNKEQIDGRWVWQAPIV